MGKAWRRGKGIQEEAYRDNLLRNVSNYLKKRDQDKSIKEARAIYNANNRKEALKAYHRWTRRCRAIAPKAVQCMEKDLEELLNFYYCPKEIRIKVRTTNVIQRAFREVRRRTRPMSCFNNTQSIERIVFAILSRLNEQWTIKTLKEFTQKIDVTMRNLSWLPNIHSYKIKHLPKKN